MYEFRTIIKNSEQKTSFYKYKHDYLIDTLKHPMIKIISIVYTINIVSNDAASVCPYNKYPLRIVNAKYMRF